MPVYSRPTHLMYNLWKFKLCKSKLCVELYGLAESVHVRNQPVYLVIYGGYCMYCIYSMHSVTK